MRPRLHLLPLVLAAACAARAPRPVRPLAGLPPGWPSPTATTGVVGGAVVDAGTGKPLPLAMVVASPPGRPPMRSEMTDATGTYAIAALPPGRYTLLFFYGDATARRKDVRVEAGKTTRVDARLRIGQAGEAVQIREHAPTIDQGGARQGITITRDYLRNLPVQRDVYGTSFSGSTSREPAPAALPPPAADELWIIARADVPRPAEEGLGSGQLRAVPPGGKEEVALPLERTDVHARILGYVASVNVKQRYRNPYAEKIEATYVFPLPANAAVSDFIMTIGTRRIRGIIRDRAQAEELYAEARSAGYAAALLSESRPNVFSQRVANIEPGKAIDVALTYFNTLPYEDGKYTFAFPMVVGPRYDPPGSASAHVAYLRPDQASAHRLSLVVDLDAGVPIAEVASLTHAIDVRTVSPRARRITLRAGATLPNKDFVLRWKVAGAAPRPAFFVDGRTFALVLEPPATLAGLRRAPMEFVFVLDCSGSMNGQPLAAAKRAVKRVLSHTTPADTLQIIRFSDAASALGPAPVRATRANIERARAYLDSLQGQGGTTMLAGIEAALDFPHDPGRLRLVSFLTDGYIGNEAEILAATRARLGAARIFSFGVGTSVNRYLLEQLAYVGRGAAAFVGLGDDRASEEAVDAFYQRISHPALADVEVDWNGLQATDVYPRRVPDLLVGRPVVLIGRMRGRLPPTLRVRGRAGGRAVSYTVPIPVGALTPHPALTKLWARARIADLEDRALGVAPAEQSTLDAAIRDVALRHGLLSPFTAFVAVDAFARTRGAPGATVPVAVPVPEGVRYETTVGPR